MGLIYSTSKPWSSTFSLIWVSSYNLAPVCNISSQICSRFPLPVFGSIPIITSFRLFLILSSFPPSLCPGLENGEMRHLPLSCQSVRSIGYIFYFSFYEFIVWPTRSTIFYNAVFWLQDNNSAISGSFCYFSCISTYI